TNGLPVLPQGWAWCDVDTVLWNASYGTSQKCTADAKGPPVLRIPNVLDEAVNLKNLKYATAPDDLRPGEVLETNDFIFIRTNGSPSLIGRGALLDRKLPGPHYFASYLIRLRLIDIGSVPEWTFLVWHSSVVRQQIAEAAASSAGHYNLSLNAAAHFVLPLPPAAQQRRI